MRERGTHTHTQCACSCVFVSVCLMPQRAAGLFRLATPVHRGQSSSNRKCVYKWGSYFYCVRHFTRSTSTLILYLTRLLFQNILLLFSVVLLFSPTCVCSLIPESAEVSFLEVPLLSSPRFLGPPGIHQGCSCPGHAVLGQLHSTLTGIPCVLLCSRRVRKSKSYFDGRSACLTPH